MDKIKITIPFMSISVNEAFAWYPKRHKSNSYKEFENKMFKFFAELWERFEITWENFLEVKYIFYFKIYNKDWSIKQKDTFNYEKVLSDCLSKHIKGFEDKKIKYWIVWKIDSDTEKMEVEIKEIIINK